MAEAAGLAIGIVGLATTFDSVLNCFEYVHLAKSVGADFEDCLLKLDNARLRLSRWGEAIGLNKVNEDTKSLRGTKITEDQIPHAEKLLGQILKELKGMEARASEFKAGKMSNDKSLAVESVEAVLSYTGMSLHEKMKQIARSRQNHLSIRQKAKWAVYERKHFDSMIKNLGEKTKDLQELFPGAQGVEKALIDKETLELSDSLRILKNAIQDQDKTLASALEELLKPAVEKFDPTNTVTGGTVGVMAAFKGKIDQDLRTMQSERTH